MAEDKPKKKKKFKKKMPKNKIGPKEKEDKETTIKITKECAICGSKTELHPSTCFKHYYYKQHLKP